MSGLIIPEILINIMSCHDFYKYKTSTVILSCRSALVPYHISKGFFIVETEEGGPNNIPISVKNETNSVNLHN